MGSARRFDGRGDRAATARRDREQLTARAPELPALIAELHAIPRLPPVSWPPELAIEELRPAPVPVLRLESPAQVRWQPDRVFGTLLFDYTGDPIAADHPASALVSTSRRRIVLRDRNAEAAALAKL